MRAVTTIQAEKRTAARAGVILGREARRAREAGDTHLADFLDRLAREQAERYSDLQDELDREEVRHAAA